jgi:hypothetical protein
LPFSGTEQRSPTALALPPTPEVVRHSGKEGRAGPARSALPVVDVIAGVSRHHALHQLFLYIRT